MVRPQTVITAVSNTVRPELSHAQKHYARAAVVGLVAGAVAVGFQWALTLTERARGEMLGRLHALPYAQWWAWSILPAVGMALGCFVGWLVVRFAPDAPGSGIPHVKGVLIHVRKMKWKGLLPVKFVGGVLGVGAGLSLGREGPTVQMGAAIGQAVGQILHVPRRTLPQLISCGAGAGLAAAFNAPLAGFLFVLEELHREMSALTFGGALIAAVCADILTRSLTGSLPSFSVQGFPGLPLGALPAVALLGLAGGVLGVIFNGSLLWSQRKVQRIRRVPRWALPGLAAAICGLLAWWMPDAIGGGHSVADRLLSGKMLGGAGVATWGLVILLVVKFLATMLSYASGAPGGIFAPMLLIGAIGGAIMARLVAHVAPSMSTSLDAFAVIGMAALFTGSVRAPLTGIVLIVEMTSNYEQLLPLCVACLIAHLVADHLRGRPIYEQLLEEDLKVRGMAGAAGHGLDGEARTVVMGVQRDSALAGKAVAECNLPDGCVLAAIERGGRELLPTPDRVLFPGDHITVLVPADAPEKALAVVDLARAG